MEKDMRNIVLFGALLVGLGGCGTSPDKCGCIDHEDVLNFYEDSVEEMQAKISLAFDAAEKEVLKDSVVVPDDVPNGPHEDPKKCACGGTGKIKHGDGHTTPCPFHSGEYKTTSPNVDGNILYKRSK